MRVSAVIAAGGQGTRVGGDVPKQLQDLGGTTLLALAVKPVSYTHLTLPTIYSV